MRRTKRLILRITCVILFALAALLALHALGIVPPVGVGWGDGTKAHGYEVFVSEGALGFRSATGMKTPSAGGLTYGVRTLGRFDGAGVHYHKWNMILSNPYGTALPGDLGLFTDLRISLIWPILILAAAYLLCLLLLKTERQRWRGKMENRCRNCGYDLRATPDRCPECGLIAAGNPPNAEPTLKEIPIDP